MLVHLAAYGSIAGDGRGYRWLWHSPAIPVAKLGQALSCLRLARFSDATLLKRLAAGELHAGLVSLDTEWCLLYRVLHGGRDRSREKVHVAVGFLPRTQIAGLPIPELLQHPHFSRVEEDWPKEVTLSPAASASSQPTTPSVRGIEVFPRKLQGWSAVNSVVVQLGVVPKERRFELCLMGTLADSTAELELGDIPEPLPAAAKPVSVVPGQSAPAAGLRREQLPAKPLLARQPRLLVVGLIVLVALAVWRFTNQTPDPPMPSGPVVTNSTPSQPSKPNPAHGPQSRTGEVRAIK